MPHRVALALVLTALLVALPSGVPLAAAPAAQPLAPENLRCPGRTLPEPQEWYRWEWHWETLDSYRFPAPLAATPYAVALDRNCNLYVADSENDQSVKLSPDGAVLARFPTPRDAGGTSGLPQGVAVDGQGNVYASYGAARRVLKFSPQGQLIATWGLCPPGRACDPSREPVFIGPEGLAADGAGNVYVMEGGRIQKLTSEGQPVAIWEMRERVPGTAAWILGQPAIDLAGNLYVAEGFNHLVLKFSPDGALLNVFGSGPEGSSDPGRFRNPTGIAVDQAGQMYVAERYNWRVQKLAPDGSFLDQWRRCLDGPLCQIIGGGDGPGEFANTFGAVADGQGNVYIADGGNNRVQRLMAHPVLIPEEERPRTTSGG